MPQAPNTEALDDHLKNVVDALHGAVGYEMPHVMRYPTSEKKHPNNYTF